MSKVFVLDTNKQPLHPIHPGRARTLLDSGKAAIFKRFPFTIILKVEVRDPVIAEIRIKIDPGSKTTGIAVLSDQSGEVVFAAELSHRGHKIKESLDSRRAIRNMTRWELFRRLETLGLPVECGSGGRTKYNRSMRELPKTHWIDAACVEESTPEILKVAGVRPLLIAANGHGCRQMCRMDKYGFPRTGPKEAKFVKGFQTGDIVKAIVTSGKKVGTYTGRVAVRSTGSFNITTKQTTVQGISYKYCQAVHRMDGYSYQKGERPQCGPPK